MGFVKDNYVTSGASGNVGTLWSFPAPEWDYIILRLPLHPLILNRRRGN
jgi:hypothetical protein